jgi:hypothetical protein
MLQSLFLTDPAQLIREHSFSSAARDITAAKGEGAQHKGVAEQRPQAEFTSFPIGSLLS